MKNKVCLVTGANSGIGFYAAVEFARRGATVVLGCRDKARGEAARDEARKISGEASVEFLLLDLGSLEAVRAAAEEFKRRYARLDALINNAGVWHMKRELTKDGFESTFGVNHLGHFLFTNLLLDRLKASAPARVVNVTSKLHFRGRMDWDDLQAGKSYGGRQAYSDSKLANVLFTRELARRLAGTKVTVNCVHPGVIATGLARELPGFLRWILPLILTTPERGAEPLVRLAAAPDVEGVTGRYFDKLVEEPASPEARDDAAASRLWQASEKLLGLN